MNIETFVETYGGRYKSYRGGWLLCCPLDIHTDNSPSFSLSTNGLFHCWSCGAKGNYTRLLHDVAKFSWKKSSETVSLLNLRKEWTKKEKRIYEQHEKPTISSAILGLYDVDWFHAYEMYQAHATPTGRRPPWALVFDKGFLPQTLTDFEAGYDSEEQRVTIPIWNYQKKLVGILGRACGKTGFKYYPYQKFNYTGHVYNLQATGIGEPVVMVEGAFDCWMLHQWGVPLTPIATMTSHISEQQVSEILEKHSHISIFYDNDSAGWKGAAQAARALTLGGGKVDIISATEGIKDIKEMNSKQFMRQYRRRTPYPCVVGDINNPHNKVIRTFPDRVSSSGVT